MDRGCFFVTALIPKGTTDQERDRITRDAKEGAKSKAGNREIIVINVNFV